MVHQNESQLGLRSGASSFVGGSLSRDLFREREYAFAVQPAKDDLACRLLFSQSRIPVTHSAIQRGCNISSC